MFTKSAILLFELVFFFNTIKYNTVEATGQELTVKISFWGKDHNSMTFFTEQLVPVFEDLSKCVKWDFHPLYPPQLYADQQSDLNKVYVCARHHYKTSAPYELANFYICMMTVPGGEKFAEGIRCASKTNLDWNVVNNCTPNELFDIEMGDGLKIMLNDECIPNIKNRFKYEVCKKLGSLNLSCACCH